MQEITLICSLTTLLLVILLIILLLPLTFIFYRKVRYLSKTVKEQSKTISELMNDLKQLDEVVNTVVAAILPNEENK